MKKNNIGRVALALWMAIGLFLFSTSLRDAQTQDITEVRVHPEESIATEGDSVVVTVDVIRGENLSGYDLTITYDASVVSMASWAHGSYLSNLAVVYKNIQPGIIRLAAVQVAQPGVSGDGTLLILTFNAKHTGESAIVIDSIELATANSTSVIPATSDAVIRVNAPATATPTSTQTPTLTLTPTVTLTRTPTRTFTATYTRTPGAGDTKTPTLMGTDYPAESTDTPAVALAEGTVTPQPASGGAESTNVFSSGTAIFPSGKTRTSQGEDQMTLQVSQEMTPSMTEGSSSMRELNRLLWGFAILLLTALAIMVIILIRHGKHQKLKG